MARQQTPEARFEIADNIEQINRGTVDRNDAFINEMFGNKSGFVAKEEAMQAAKEKARPLFNELENMGDLETYEIQQNLKKIKPERYKSATPQTGLTPDEYANIIQQQADELGVNIAKGNKEKINHGAMHFVLNDAGKISNRAPFVGTLKETYSNPDITFAKGGDKNFIRAIQDTVRNEKHLDNLVTRNNEFYTKYLADEANIAKKMRSPLDDLSISGDFLSDMGISPSVGSKYNISHLGEIVKENDVIADAISKVKRSYSSLKNLPDTDARVILEARKLLSKQSANQLDSTAAYQARQALKEFDPALKNVFGDKLEQANKLYAGAHQFENAYEQGSNIFNKMTPDEFGNMLKNMTADEKIALKGGMKDELWNIIHGRENETLGWKRVVPKSAQDKIRMALGEKEGNKLIAYANAEIKKMRNFNELLRGSQTSEKQKLRDGVGFVRKILKNPTGIIGEVLPAANARNRGIAEIMTNPSATTAREAFNQVVNPTSKLEALYQALYNPSGNTTAVNAALAAYLANMPLKNN